MKQWRYLADVTEQQVWDYQRAKGKAKLSLGVVRYLKDKSPEFVDQDQVVSLFVADYKPNTIRVTLSVLKGIGAVECRGSNKTSFINTDFLLTYPSIKTWLSELADGKNRKNSLLIMKHFLDYLKTSRAGNSSSNNRFDTPRQASRRYTRFAQPAANDDCACSDAQRLLPAAQRHKRKQSQKAL
ncbi:MAG: hypothetical protein ACRDF4_04555 [Rhabdochlamydiaceae bacterium]